MCLCQCASGPNPFSNATPNVHNGVAVKGFGHYPPELTVYPDVHTVDTQTQTYKHKSTNTHTKLQKGSNFDKDQVQSTRWKESATSHVGKKPRYGGNKKDDYGEWGRW